jgi:hypothetical protein
MLFCKVPVFITVYVYELRLRITRRGEWPVKEVVKKEESVYVMVRGRRGIF